MRAPGNRSAALFTSLLWRGMAMQGAMLSAIPPLRVDCLVFLATLVPNTCHETCRLRVLATFHIVGEVALRARACLPGRWRCPRLLIGIQPWCDAKYFINCSRIG